MDWTQVLSQLIEMVKTTAPDLWRIANTQVQAQIYCNQFWGIFLAVVSTIILVIVLALYFKRDTMNDNIIWVVILSIFLAITTLLSAVCFVTLRMMAMSPEYYAIQQIMQLIPQK